MAIEMSSRNCGVRTISINYQKCLRGNHLPLSGLLGANDRFYKYIADSVLIRNDSGKNGTENWCTLKVCSKTEGDISFLYIPTETSIEVSVML